MAIIVSTDVADLVFGLHWSPLLPGESTFVKTLQLGRKVKAKYRIHFRANGLVAIGVASKPIGTPISRKSTFFCAAVLFAKRFTSSENSLFIHPLSSTQFLVIAVTGGVPYLECIISPDHIASRINSLEAETQCQFTRYGTCTVLDHMTSLSLIQLLSQASVSTHLVPFTDTRSIKTLISLGIFFAVLFGANEIRKMRMQYLAEEEARLLAIDPVNAYTNSLNRLLATAGFSGSHALSYYWGGIADRQISLEGWTAKSIVFKSDTATEVWTMSPGASEANLKVQLGPGARVVKSGKDTTVLRKIHAPRSSLVRVRLPEYRTHLTRLKTIQLEMAASGMRMTYQIPKIAGLPSDLSVSQIPPRITVAKGTFTVEGNIGQLEELLAVFDPNQTIDELSIQTPGSVTDARFSIRGTYYVKN